MSLATGRWTGLDISKPKVGSDPVVVVVNPAPRSLFKTIVILAAVATGIYILTPTAVHYYKHGRLPGREPSCDDHDHDHETRNDH